MIDPPEYRGCNPGDRWHACRHCGRAQASEHQGAVRSPAPEQREAILNPFSLYEKGETLLRQELSALSPWHLSNIALSYDLTRLPEPALQAMRRPELIALIVDGVRLSSPSRNSRGSG